MGEERYRQLQGMFPVIFISFASVETGKIEEVYGALEASGLGSEKQRVKECYIKS